MKRGRLFAILLASAGASFAQMSIVNGASYAPGQAVAPGSFAAMFGENLCGQTASGNWVGPGQLPTTLGGCSVTLNGMPAMLSYVSAGQVNFIVPPGIGPGTAAVSVNNGSGVQAGSVAIAQAAPGVFAMTGMGVGMGAIMNGITWTPAPFSTTTNGQGTAVAMYVTGLDLSNKPVVSIGGMPADVMWYGNAPDLAGLQQINVSIPAGVAGTGRVPVTVTSGGVTSNVTYMAFLPTDSMMQGMPGWGAGMTIGENAPRAHELSQMAFNPANGTALVSDSNDDVVRVISVDSRSTVATITLPSGSEAGAIAVNDSGTLAGVALTAKASVAVLDLTQNKAVAVVGTGNYPSHLAFAGSDLLVTNGASGTVSVIDTDSGMVSQTIDVGFGASGIATNGSVAVVANLQGGSLSEINLVTYAVTTIPLPTGTRPHDVALDGGKAIVTTPMSAGFLIVDLGTGEVTKVDTSAWNAIGPGAVAAYNGQAFVANQMTASVTVADVAGAKVLTGFPVDPGPRSLAVDPAANALLVLAEGTGTLDVVDLASYAITARIDAGMTERLGNWALPQISSMTPNTAAAGTTFTLTIDGTNLQSVKDIEFELTGVQAGGGMMGGGMMGGGMGGQEDANIQVSGLQVNSAGTAVTATVQVLSAAAAGTRQVRLVTDQGEVMGPMWNSFFTVTRTN